MPIPFQPTKAIPYTPGQNFKTDLVNPPERNILQKTAGVFLDPVAKLAAEGGQALGVGLLKGADYLSGGKLGKLTPEGNMKEALARSTAKPTVVPGLGTPVKPIKDVGVKEVAGQAAGVAGLLTGNPLLGGALLMGGGKLEEGGSAGDVALSSIGGAIAGKILEVGFKAVAPTLEKALQKYGKPLYDKVESSIPQAVKDTYKLFAEKAPLSKVEVPNAPKGNFVNIGMNTNVGGKLSEKDIIKALPKDVKILNKNIIKDPTENTFVAEFSRPLTQEEHYAFTKALKQDAIPQMINGKGTMTNVGQKSWGSFNPEYFKDLSGKTLGATPKVTTGLDKFQEGAKKVEEKISGTIKSASEKLGITKPAATADEKIAELIAPKPTAKEAKLAEMQGRLYKGKEPTLLKGGKPDRIATSPEQLKQVQTIKTLIPGAEKMDEPTLYTSLTDGINGLATRLKPEAQKVAISEATVEKITSGYKTAAENLKKQSIYFPKDVNTKELQKDFENRLFKSKSNNMNDLWETAKAYDKSVPTNVKNANDLSSEALQAKKSIWLQYRKVIKDAINDSKNGLGDTSRKAFEDMHNMYEAQQGILSKAEVDLTTKGSKAGEFIKKHKVSSAIVGGTILGAAGVPAASKALHAVGSILP